MAALFVTRLNREFRPHGLFRLNIEVQQFLDRYGLNFFKDV